MARSRKERGEFSKVQIFGQHHSNRRILQLPDPVLDTRIEHLGTKLVRSIGTRVRNEKNLQSKIYQMKRRFKIFLARREAADLERRQLRDIGITREQAEREAGKPIWKDYLDVS